MAALADQSARDWPSIAREHFRDYFCGYACAGSEG